MKHKSIALAAIMTLVSFAALSQSCASSCSTASACGPGNTKKGEAKAIADLRTSLQEVLNGFSASKYAQNSTLIHVKLEAGSTDDESLLFLVQVSNAVRTELTSKIPGELIHQGLKNYEPKPALNKQQLVASLRTDIKLFQDQIAKL